ncbi:MAG TPA: gamma-glutamyltransferase [Actinomycetota bacterium]|nr:gamma-glutamyltransferase [Actinomycetota bacterium]
MPHPRLAVSAGNVLATKAAVRVAEAGGNAVDAALTSAIMGWVAEPFFASIGGSGFITVASPDGTVEVFDGNDSMPTTQPSEPGHGIERIFLPEYADGIFMGIGPGSVAVPGVLAAVRLAWEKHGRIEWAALFEDAIAAARDGFPFPEVSDYYITCTWDEIWSKFPGSRQVFGVADTPIRSGEMLQQPLLAEALELIAAKGPDVFYRGELAEEIAQSLAAGGGFLGVQDLDGYRAQVRAPITTNAFGWDIYSNPPPAVGGAVLIHMLALLQDADLRDPVTRLNAFVSAQDAAMGYRRERYQDPEGVAAAFDEALNVISQRSRRSPSTTHASTADSDGYACAVTESNGYGSGLVVHGMLLNNTLGEEELNPMGVHRLPPGTRCHSNMAPTIARREGRAVALGSPGADRIVGAIVQALLHIVIDDATLEEAVGAPRAHLDLRPEGETLCYEPGLPGDQLTFRPRPYQDRHMYFGAVQAASVNADGTVDAAHDPRRSGGSALV